MSNFATNNNKILQQTIIKSLKKSTEIDPVSSSDSNQNVSKNSKKNKKRKKKAHSGPSAQQPVKKKTRNDYEHLMKLTEANQIAELNGYKIEGILKSVRGRDLRQPVKKKTRNDYEHLMKLTEANQIAELNGYKIEGILKSVRGRDLRLMSNETLKELKYQLNEAIWDQKAWCEHVECSRETAIAKGELGGYCSGEFGPYYFFFAPTQAAEFTSKQRGMLGDHIACCFMNNQPCACQINENHDGDPCECKMGDSNGSYWFEMGLGPATFEQECSEGLVKPKWVMTTDSDCLPWTADIEKLYNLAQLKEAIGDFNQFDPDKLARIAKYLANPVGKLVLSEKESISSVIS